MSERVTTHYFGCWKDPRHHACALTEIARLRAALRGIFVYETVGSGIYCNLCKRHSYDATAERHAPGCLAEKGDK